VLPVSTGVVVLDDIQFGNDSQMLKILLYRLVVG
jgi:hypothetical protein